MFTGIVECTGTVTARTPIAKGARYTIDIPFAAELALGDSVAVNGCCLTVDRISGTAVEFDLPPKPCASPLWASSTPGTDAPR